ncbi:MAG: tRNA (adenosine(37)-N6)-dimethylallyltransferase MiaA [Candidatus Peregrinibacteria bacterium]|nr:tRNA (adenosine(37)-N6)-dimethylallyltransferase MiaA [Candidatus Peregrinibacteria bacterium]
MPLPIPQQLIDSVSADVARAKRPLLVVLGPTASGKTAFSIALAHAIGKAEIVNADSRQLYKELDIGTTKVTEEEMQGVPHHLIDVLDPRESLTVAWYRDRAFAKIDELHSRGMVPILVGGSMLYISAIIDGLSLVESVDAELRARLQDEYARDGGQSLYARLREVDPETAESFHQNNMPYVVRAMEIYEATGEKPSQRKRKSDCPYDLTILGMEWPREDLRKRIDARTEELFARGWIAEVQSLLDRGYTRENPGMVSSGYREIIDFLAKKGPATEGELHADITAKTRKYAKRQMTWWRGDERIQWIPYALSE